MRMNLDRRLIALIDKAAYRRDKLAVKVLVLMVKKMTRIH